MFSTKAEQGSLFGPVGGQMCRQPHQFLGIELWRLPAVDNRGGDVRCEPAKAQQDIEVGGRDALFAGDVMHGEACVFGEASSGYRERARQFSGGPYRVLYCRRNRRPAISFRDRPASAGLAPSRSGCDRMNRSAYACCIARSIDVEASNAARRLLRDIDLDAIRPDLDAADQGHKDCLDPLRCLTKLIGDLARALDQRPSSDYRRRFHRRWHRAVLLGWRRMCEAYRSLRIRGCLRESAGALSGFCRHR